MIRRGTILPRSGNEALQQLYILIVDLGASACANGLDLRRRKNGRRIVMLGLAAGTAPVAAILAAAAALLVALAIPPHLSSELAPVAIAAAIASIAVARTSVAEVTVASAAALVRLDFACITADGPSSKASTLTVR